MVRQQDVLSDPGQPDLVQRYSAPSRPGRGVAGHAVQDRRRVRRVRRGQGGQTAREDAHARLRVVQGRRFRRSVPRARVLQWLQAQEPHDPPRRHHAPAQLVPALHPERHRPHQDRDIAVHRHQLAHGDVPLGGQAGREPGDDGEEQGGQADAEGLHPAGDRAHPVALGPQALGVAVEGVGDQGLAAEAVEDAQPAREVGDTGGEDALAVAVLRLGALQSGQERPHQDDDRRDAEEDHGREDRGDRDQQGGDRQIGDAGTDTRADDGQGLGDRLHVAHTDRDDLPGPGPARERGAETDRLRDDHLDRAEVGVHPHPGHRAVPHDAQPGVERPDREQREAPAGQRRPVARLKAFVDRLRHQVRRRRQQHHPGTAQQRPGHGPSRLTAHQPPQIPPAAPDVGRAGILVRVDHTSPWSPLRRLTPDCPATPGADRRTGRCPRRVRPVCRPRRSCRAP